MVNPPHSGKLYMWDSHGLVIDLINPQYPSRTYDNFPVECKDASTGSANQANQLEIQDIDHIDPQSDSHWKTNHDVTNHIKPQYPLVW